MFVFASDVHLTDAREERFGVFEKWLRSLADDSEVKRVFLLGDIFDLWLGDRKCYQEQYKDIVSALEILAKAKDLHIFEGNHDFQFGSFWTNKGIDVHRDFYEFEFEGKKWVLTHGDLLDPSDYNYRTMRGFFRSRFARFLIKSFPEKFAYKIGQSINTTPGKEDFEITEDLKVEFNKKWMKWTWDLQKKMPFDYFVCGHFHYRTIFDEESFTAVNLGSWLSSPFKYLKFDGEEFKFIEVN